MENKLLFLITQGSGKIDEYLSNVTTQEFMDDVKNLVKESSNNIVIENAIDYLKQFV